MCNGNVYNVLTEIHALGFDANSTTNERTNEELQASQHQNNTDSHTFLKTQSATW